MAAELESHLALHIEDNLRAGMTSEEARRRALIRLGGLEQAKELYRERRGIPFLETIWQDVRYGARMLRKAPGFVAVAVLTMALGVGANSATFSMVYALLLHPYNFRDLDRIVLVWENHGSDAGFDARFISPGDARDIASNAGIFSSLATYRCHAFSLTSAAEVIPVNGCNVSANFFDLLGVRPAAGRAFAKSEQQPGLDAVAVVSHRFWQSQLGANPRAIHSFIQLNGRSYAIIGIMPPDFNFPAAMQLWIPLAQAPAQQTDRARLSVQSIARLKPGLTATQAQATLAGFSARLAAEYPKTNTGRSGALLPLRRELYQFTMPLFGLLQFGAACVLLLACANLANLFYARMIGRQKEIAVREALGASRGRLARLLLSEAILISLLAACVAIVVSAWTIALLRASITPDWTQWVPGWEGIRVNPAVLGLTVLLAAGAGVFLGLTTAAHAGRVDLNQTLKESGAGPIGRTQARLRSALIVAQVVIALVLLVCAGLAVQGFLRVANIYARLQPESVMKFEPVWPANTFTDPVRIARFYEDLLNGTKLLPGVTAAALASNWPASNVDNTVGTFEIEGRPTPLPGRAPSAALQIVSPEYFRALRIPVISGRAFTSEDNAGGAPVAVISRSMAEKFWLGGDAVGRHIRLTASDAAPGWVTIVGVVGDVRQNWWDSPSQSLIYRPFSQAPGRGIALLLRASGDPRGYVPPVHLMLRRLDPTVALAGVSTLQREVINSIGIIRILGILMGVFGLIALGLSVVGVYGVISENVARDARAIGIRLALGASPRAVQELTLSRGLKLAATGVAIAIPIALAVNRLMASYITGIVSISFAVVAAFSALLILATLAACYVPARRAMRVDPMTALRQE
jgi:predicted permease